MVVDFKHSVVIANATMVYFKIHVIFNNGRFVTKKLIAVLLFTLFTWP